MSNKINTVQISGTSYSIEDSGATRVLNVTQAEYDALVTGGTVDPTVLYNITDATSVDISQYWTSAQTNSAITQAVSGKADTTAVTESISQAVSGKQDTLSAGTGIDITDNVISATGGGGGGKAVSGGTNISVTTGETADTINCTLPISVHSDANKGDILIGAFSESPSDYFRLLIGRNIASSHSVFCSCSIGINIGDYGSELYGRNCVGIGNGFKIGNGSYYSNTVTNCVAIGKEAKTRINDAVAIGYNAEASGTTKTNINNQLKIDTSNQIYIMNKDNTQEICLQDALGGGGTIDQTVISGSTNAVAGGAVYDQLGGLKLVKLTQSAYDALSPNYDNNTLYVIVN